MGKAQKIKEQRKIEQLKKKIKKDARFKTVKLVVAGVSLGILIGVVIFMGIKMINWNSIKNWKIFNENINSSVEAKDFKTGLRKYSQAPNMQIDVDKKYIAKFETAEGNFEISLDAKNAPKTVNNFVVLAKDKFYDGLTFHRIVKDFMIQGGDPEGTGTGGPGYKFDDETVVGDYTKGTVAMANSGENTNGSQFFIMTGDYSGGKLAKDYVIFGHVTSGMDTIMKLNQTETTIGTSGEQSTPKYKIVINKVIIEEK